MHKKPIKNRIALSHDHIKTFLHNFFIINEENNMSISALVKFSGLIIMLGEIW